MNTAFTVIVYTGIFLAIIVTFKIISLFLNINAKIDNRRYMGVIKEWINLDQCFHQPSDYVIPA